MKLREFLESENRVNAYWSPDKTWSVRRRDNIGGDEWWTIFHNGTALPFGGKTYQEAIAKLKKEYNINLAKGISEDKGDEKELQDMADKAEKDVNADWDPPSKKQQTLKEAKELKSLKIEIEMGNDSMKTSIDAETAIKEAFKKLRLGSGGPAFVKIYDENGNSVGSLEVK